MRNSNRLISDPLSGIRAHSCSTKYGLSTLFYVNFGSKHTEKQTLPTLHPEYILIPCFCRQYCSYDNSVPNGPLSAAL